jgi:hypothetical protein
MPICRVFFLDAIASRRRKQQIWHRPELNDKIRATHSERRRGKWLRNRGQIPGGSGTSGQVGGNRENRQFSSLLTPL